MFSTSLLQPPHLCSPNAHRSPIHEFVAVSILPSFRPALRGHGRRGSGDAHPLGEHQTPATEQGPAGDDRGNGARIVRINDSKKTQQEVAEEAGVECFVRCPSVHWLDCTSDLPFRFSTRFVILFLCVKAGSHAPHMVKRKGRLPLSSQVKHAHDFENDFCDPASWNAASYSPDLLDEIEPLPDKPNGYRSAALYHLQIMLAVDEFITAAEDARLAVVAVSVERSPGPALSSRKWRISIPPAEFAFILPGAGKHPSWPAMLPTLKPRTDAGSNGDSAMNLRRKAAELLKPSRREVLSYRHYGTKDT